MTNMKLLDRAAVYLTSMVRFIGPEEPSQIIRASTEAVVFIIMQRHSTTQYFK